MASTYSTNLAIELIGTGDQAGSWGNTTNTNLGTLIEQAISGYVTQAVSTGTDTTITIPNGATGVARNMYIELTGTGGTNTNLIVPANKKLYFIFNNSTGAVTVKVSGQTGVSVPTGKKMVLVSNGTDVVVAENYIADFGSNSATITNLTCTSLTLSNNPTFSGGTANGVLYLNGSKVATSGSALVFDGTNLSATRGLKAASAGIAVSSFVDGLNVGGYDSIGFLASPGNALAIGGYRAAQWSGLEFYTAGALQATLTSTGLGIGTASPSDILTLAGGASGSYGLTINNAKVGGGTKAIFQYDATNQIALVGGNTTNGLAFQTLTSGSLTTKAVIDSSGNLGIGTASPTSKLDLVGVMQWQATAGTVLGKLTYAGGEPVVLANTGLGLNFYTNNAFAAKIDTSGNLGLGVTPSASLSPALQVFSGASYNGLGTGAQIGANTYFGASSAWRYIGTGRAARIDLNAGDTGEIRFFNTSTSGTAGNAISFTQALTLDASGNLGVGTTSPSSRLDVARSDSSTYDSSNMLAGGQWQRITNSDTTANNSTLLFFNPNGAWSGISGINTGTNSGTLAFGTRNAGGNLTERARITSGGDFLTAGKTTASFTTVGAELLANGQINTASANLDNLNVYNTTAAAYRFYVSSGGTVFATNTTISAISDQRLKENVRDLDVGLDAIMALKPRKFDWKEGKGQDKKDVRGFIAQEFEQVFPDLIDEWKDPAPEGEEPYKSVRQDLIPVLVKAIQELSAKVAALEAK